MLGPSRCGKTTLLASIVHEFMELSEKISLRDTEFIKLSPKGDTRGRINLSIDAISASTSEGEFIGGALEGTQDHSIYDLELSYQKKSVINSDPNFKLHFHDFPGGWLGTGDKRLDDVKFREAEILLMPIDASLVFEAVRTSHKASANMQLELRNLEEVAKAWANARREYKNHPGLFILAPVKCETYFNDNLPVGLKKDSSRELKKKMDQFFGKLVKTVKGISPETQILYMPVDTIGCCFINDREWIPSPKYGSELQVKYKIPYGLEWTPHGPAQIMLKIIEYLINDYQDNQGWLDRLLSFMGWNTDFGSKIRKMQAEMGPRYKRQIEL